MSATNKVTIIGSGFVGSTTAYALIAEGVAEEIVLIDINAKLVAAEVMDLQHSVPFWGYTRVRVGNYRDIKDSKIVVITCGAAQKPGESRLDLVKKNSAIITGIMPEVFKQNSKAIVVMVTNPVDVLTYLTVKMFPAKKKQIIGSGTILDSARLRFLLGQKMQVDPASVHAYIVGEHGDSEVALWSTASIGSTPLDRFKKLSAGQKKQLFGQAKNAAYAIIEGKKATYYAIAAGAAQIVKTILYDKRTVLPVSHFISGQYGINDICLSLPAVVGAAGIIREVDVALSALEKKQLIRSAQALKRVTKTVV